MPPPTKTEWDARRLARDVAAGISPEQRVVLNSAMREKARANKLKETAKACKRYGFKSKKVNLSVLDAPRKGNTIHTA